MTNPWLTVPLSDYEGHMNAPQVAQLRVLADLFAAALEAAQPASVAVIGVAGGNGLDRIDTRTTKRVTGYDIHAGYLAAARERYKGLPGLELIEVDLAAKRVTGAFDLVHAALVFEHAGTDLCLDNALALTRPGGVLSVVLQRPSTLSSNEAAAVAPTGYTSLQNLALGFRMIEPDHLVADLAPRGFTLRQEAIHPVASGKALWHALFHK